MVTAATGPETQSQAQPRGSEQFGKLNSAVNLLCETYLNSKQEIGLGHGNPRGNWIQKLVWKLESTSWTNIYKGRSYLRPTVEAALGLTGDSNPVRVRFYEDWLSFELSCDKRLQRTTNFIQRKSPLANLGSDWSKIDSGLDGSRTTNSVVIGWFLGFSHRDL